MILRRRDRLLRLIVSLNVPYCNYIVELFNYPIQKSEWSSVSAKRGLAVHPCPRMRIGTARRYLCDGISAGADGSDGTGQRSLTQRLYEWKCRSDKDISDARTDKIIRRDRERETKMTRLRHSHRSRVSFHSVTPVAEGGTSLHNFFASNFE